jgi:hypothetical protein
MPEYILFLYESPAAFDGISPEEMQAVIKRYTSWRDSLAARGHAAGGKKLRDGVGRVMKRHGGKTAVKDGPYTESREVIGGFFTFHADSFDQAAELARDCPHLEYGVVEIREVDQH